MKLSNLVVVSTLYKSAISFTTTNIISTRSTTFITNENNDNKQNQPHSSFSPPRCSSILMTSSNTNEKDIKFVSDPYEIQQKKINLSQEEISLVYELYKLKDDNDDNKILQEKLISALPSISPSLVVALRNASSLNEEVDVDDEDGENEKVLKSKEFIYVGKVLQEVTEIKLNYARELLSNLLDCGEIRKLDKEITIASKNNDLDMAFFQVLNMNIMDSFREQQQQTTPQDDEESPSANRYQILQHIYTRCQEEVEKNVKPGVALLNKLLRTDVSSIRDNQIRHYLIPQTSSTIVTPDGKELTIKNENAKALVPTEEFIDALADAVQRIRTLENTGGIANKATTAGIIEDCRKIAIEVRMVVFDVYGESSMELREFENGLQPVFRPNSPLPNPSS